MKKLTTKLSLNKHTLASLDHAQMASIKGGFTYSLTNCPACRTKGNGGGGSKTH